MTTHPTTQSTVDAGPGARVELPATMADADCVRIANSRMREWVGTRRIWRGSAPAQPLPRRLTDLDSLEVHIGNRTLTMREALARLESVGLLILHQGAVVYERYFHDFPPHQTYQLASVSKVFVGLTNSILADQGVIDRTALVRRYVPQLAGTSFGEATVEDLTDMQVVGRFDDHPYTHRGGARPLAEIIGGTSAGERITPTTLEWLSHAQLTEPAGGTFSYDNGTTEPSSGWCARRPANPSPPCSPS